MTSPVLLTDLLHVLVFMMGAGIGSFLNVVIYRVPLGISVNNPKRSFCPSCKNQIPWYHNVPLLSWLLLRGKCAKCSAPIAPRYFIVELLTGCLFYAIFRMYGGPFQLLPHWGPVVLVYWMFTSLLIAGTFIDIDYFILPVGLTAGGLAAGLLCSGLLPRLQSETLHWRGALMSLLAAGLGFGVLWLVVELGKLAFGRLKYRFNPPEHWTIQQPNEDASPVFKVKDVELTFDDIFARASDKLIIDCETLAVNDRTFDKCRAEIRSTQLHMTLPGGSKESIALETVKKLEGTATDVVVPREAMGFGNVILLGMIGSFLGWKAIPFTIVVSSLLGSLLASIPRIIGRAQWTAKIPFGPYLAAGAMLWLFYGPDVVRWYLSHLFPQHF